jgi:dihydropteroate synthase
LLSASNKRYIGDLLDLAVEDRRTESLASLAYGVIQGCRVARVHDVAGSVRVARTVEAILEVAFAAEVP